MSFSPFLTQIVSGKCITKIHFCHFSHFWRTTFKNTIFIGFLGLFHFVFFFWFSVSNIKKTKTKNAIYISKTSSLTSRQFCKNAILAHIDTICVFKHTPKHYKIRENSETKTWTSFKLGPVFNLKTPKSWTSF